jgi:hypothetical protein
LAQRTSVALPQSSSHLSRVREWWEQISKATGIDSVHLLQILTHAALNIWKQRCRRVFDNKALPVDQLVMLIQHGVAAYR